MENAPKTFQRTFRKIHYLQKMAILHTNGLKIALHIHGKTTHILPVMWFHTIPILQHSLTAISMLKYVPLSRLSSIFTSTSIKDQTVQHWSFATDKMKSNNFLTLAISLLLNHASVCLNLICIRN